MFLAFFSSYERDIPYYVMRRMRLKADDMQSGLKRLQQLLPTKAHLRDAFVAGIVITKRTALAQSDFRNTTWPFGSAARIVLTGRHHLPSSCACIKAVRHHLDQSDQDLGRRRRPSTLRAAGTLPASHNLFYPVAGESGRSRSCCSSADPFIKTRVLVCRGIR